MANKKQEDSGRYLTTGERIRNFTGWAFVLAIFIELIGLPFYRGLNNVHSGPTEKPFTIIKQTIKPPPTPPPPTPTPPPTPQPRQTPQHHIVQNPKPLLVHPPKVTSGGPGAATSKYVPPPKGSENGVPRGTGTAAPVATPASCPDPNQKAHTVIQSPPDYPEQAEELNLGPVEVVVVVSLSATGQVVGTSIRSDPSNNGSIEREALRVARDSTYAPDLVDCKPVGGSYIYIIDFDPG